MRGWTEAMAYLAMGRNQLALGELISTGRGLQKYPLMLRDHEDPCAGEIEVNVTYDFGPA